MHLLWLQENKAPSEWPSWQRRKSCGNSRTFAWVRVQLQTGVLSLLFSDSTQTPHLNLRNQMLSICIWVNELQAWKDGECSMWGVPKHYLKWEVVLDQPVCWETQINQSCRIWSFWAIFEFLTHCAIGSANSKPTRHSSFSLSFSSFLDLGGHKRARSIHRRLHFTVEKCHRWGCWKIQGHCSERPWRVQCDNQPQFRQ